MIETFSKYIYDKDQKYIIFDVGSRDCEQAIEFYKMFPNSFIYAFECNPNTLDICKKNIENYKDRITLVEMAVCNYDGEIDFFPIDQKNSISLWKDGNPGASSLFKGNQMYETNEKYIQYQIKTKCCRLDTFMKNNNLNGVDIIWMDAQGAELIILQGMGKYLKTLKYLYTEVSYKELYTGQVLFDQLNYFLLENNFELCNNLLRLEHYLQEDAIYIHKSLNFKNFDIIICVGPKDEDILNEQINFTKNNIIGYRNIYLVCKNKNIKINGCITIDENSFPFNIETVAKFHGHNDRNGWYLQQLLKLYSVNSINGILDNVLSIDCDTFFIKPVSFFEKSKTLYSFTENLHVPYFTHMYKLNDSFNCNPFYISGIVNYMMFQKNVIDEIISTVENIHKDKFYNVFLKSVDNNDYIHSGASEYEIYFNYVLLNHSDKIVLRYLEYNDSIHLKRNGGSIIVEKLDYFTNHWYNRK